MFSGITEELGQVKKLSKQGNITLLEIKANRVSQDSDIGDSVSVNGACLTVVKKDFNSLTFEVISQTLNLTNLGLLRNSDKVNLERSLKIGDRLSGHFVTGHIDCLGIIRRKGFLNSNLCFKISVPTQFLKYILPKGSIAVDGISLTIAGVKSDTFSVNIIPHTLKNTTLGFKGPSHKVNIEFDILTKKS